MKLNSENTERTSFETPPPIGTISHGLICLGPVEIPVGDGYETIIAFEMAPKP